MVFRYRNNESYWIEDQQDKSGETKNIIDIRRLDWIKSTWFVADIYNLKSLL